MQSTRQVHGCVRSSTALTHAFDRNHLATTAGSEAMSSTRFILLTTRRHFGQSGIVTSRSEAYPRRSSSHALCGVSGFERSRWPISVMRADSCGSASPCRGRAAEDGLLIKTSAKSSGRRVGAGSLPRVPHGPMDVCFVSSSTTQTFRRLRRSHQRESSWSRRCRQPGCIRSPRGVGGCGFPHGLHV